jgi:hypothetical protein
VGFELFMQNGTAGFSVAPSESGDRDGDIFQRRKTCVPVMCPTLQAPENGLILSTKVYFRVTLETFLCNVCMYVYLTLFLCNSRKVTL